MKWTMQRAGDGSVSVITIITSITEANEVLADMQTGDDSTQASKDAFRAFLSATLISTEAKSG